MDFKKHCWSPTISNIKIAKPGYRLFRLKKGEEKSSWCREVGHRECKESQTLILIQAFHFEVHDYIVNLTKAVGFVPHLPHPSIQGACIEKYLADALLLRCSVPLCIGFGGRREVALGSRDGLSESLYSNVDTRVYRYIHTSPH